MNIQIDPKIAQRASGYGLKVAGPIPLGDAIRCLIRGTFGDISVSTNVDVPLPRVIAKELAEPTKQELWRRLNLSIGRLLDVLDGVKATLASLDRCDGEGIPGAEAKAPQSGESAMASEGGPIPAGSFAPTLLLDQRGSAAP